MHYGDGNADDYIGDQFEVGGIDNKYEDANGITVNKYWNIMKFQEVSCTDIIVMNEYKIIMNL